jgi:ATP-dependent Clp protease ATP-binding subunit ClpC
MKQYTEQAQAALHYAKEAARELQQNYVGTEHLLLGLVREENGTAGRVLAEIGVEESNLRTYIDKFISAQGNVALDSNVEYSKRAQQVLQNAEYEMEYFNEEEIGTEHILIAMIKETECVGIRLLHTMGINLQKLYTEIRLAMGADQSQIKAELEQMKPSKDSKGTTTPVLDQYSRDLTEMARRRQLDPVVGREHEMERIIRILSRRTKNNPCLIGEPGVGKTAIAEGLAQKIVDGEVPDQMKDKRVVVLDLSGMVAGSKYRGEFEERIKNVVREVSDNKNILLFIDEIHTIIGAGGAEGALDASNILKPSLSRGEIQLIGATTIEEYRKYIEKDAALERRFQPVMVEEPTAEEALEILKGLKPYYEKHHGVEIEDEALKAAVAMSVRYINDRFLPDKAIDLIDEAASKVQLSGFSGKSKWSEYQQELDQIMQQKEEAVKAGDMELARQMHQEQLKLEEKCRGAKERAEKNRKGKNRKVTEEAVADIVSGWTKIPVSQLQEEETKRLAKLESILHKRVVGQEEAVTAVAKAIKRGRVGLKDPSRPIGSFLFLGPTGVGKTELSKALAEAVFGTEQAMIRVDMSEYMEKHSVSKLIGSPPGYVGYEEGGQLSEKVRRNPYSVLLFDEIEKAHPDVFNILLQVLDDGHITDAQGRKVDFKQTCIIMTSNAGAQAIIEPKRLGFTSENDEKRDYEYMKNSVMEEVKRMFKPEFLNRIDDIIVFHSLNKENIRQIVTILLRNLQKRCQEQMNITLKIRPSVKDYLAEEGYDSKYGARPLKRAIQSKIEDAMAEEILKGSIKAGDTVSVGMHKKDVKFYVSD